MDTGTPPLGTVSFPIEGMTCASCVSRITRYLRGADGVSRADVNVATETATVAFATVIACRRPRRGGRVVSGLARWRTRDEGRGLDPRGALVRVIRALDRRGGLSSRRAHRGYTRCSRLFRGLHARVVADSVAFVGERAATIVDIGSGPGDVLADLRARLPGARLVGIEPSGAMRELSLGRGVVAVEGRAEALPLDEGSADLVISSLSSHHWDDPVTAFREFARVLRPGGEARIYDVRFAGYGAGEASVMAAAAGLASESVHHRVLEERLLGLRAYALITVQAPPDTEAAS